MASHLQSARQALEAELSHAKQGCAYYTARVEALENALRQLACLDERRVSPQGNSSAANGAKRARKARDTTGANGPGQGHRAKGAARRRGPEAKRSPRARAMGNADRLPSMGGDFWLDLLDEQPRSAVDISNAAIAALGIKPDQKSQIKQLKQRVAPALSALLAARKINDSGAGRARRFFKQGSQAD